jgi:hypothetical protein
VETFNHIIIYNVVFSWINSYHFATFVAWQAMYKWQRCISTWTIIVTNSSFVVP